MLDFRQPFGYTLLIHVLLFLQFLVFSLWHN